MIDDKGRRISSDGESLECFLDTHLSREEASPLLHGLIRDISENHKDLLCGISETGTILYSNSQFRAEFSDGEAFPGPTSFFSFIHPDDVRNVHGYLSGTPETALDTDFFCRMNSYRHDTVWMKWRIWTHECLEKYTPMKYLLIGTIPSNDSSNTVITDFYTLCLQRMERARDGKLQDIQNRLLGEIEKREAIEREIATLITGMENEVVKLKEIINYTPQQVLVFDIMGELQYINSQGAEHLGSPINTLIGKNISDLPFPEQIINVVREYTNTVPDPRDPPFSGMVEITSPEPQTCFYSLMQMYDISGIRESILMILFNISNPQGSHLPPLSPFVEDPQVIVDRVLHTFNNLFTILLGNITLARCCQDLESDTSRYLKNIEGDITRAGNLLERYSLLAFSEKPPDFPFAAPDAESAPGSADSGDLLPDAENQYILFMDDEDGILDISSKVLEDLGFHVMTGHNGEAILKTYVDLKMDNQKVSCVILDLDVREGMGALETIPHLKFFDPALPVILTTGHTKHPIIKNFKKQGFSGVITKPFYPKKLEGKIREILGKCSKSRSEPS